MYKKFYQNFLKANEGVQHYAAHSHHFWPDVTRDAMMRYWDDSARLTDDKWGYFFSTEIPQTQKLISEVLNCPHPEQIVFAPNTHELAYRLLTCFKPNQKIKVLTTDSEFYSFERQVNRLSENDMVEVAKVPTQDFQTFQDRFINEIKKQDYDLIFLSHVFFNSGVVVSDLEKIVSSVQNDNCIIAIDGYHGFMAIPTDLSKIADRVFYIAGSYKYAQGGEGCCFMCVPRGAQQKPTYTGWFAGFSELSKKGAETVYSTDGLRFAGSTMDFSALYRLKAVLELFKKEKISVSQIHQHIQLLQKNFRQHIQEMAHPILKNEKILHLDFNQHGHFFAFELGDAQLTQKIHDELYVKKIRTDYRGTRLRFGFGLYQDECINLINV